jgi:hypothetical protein
VSIVHGLLLSHCAFVVHGVAPASLAVAAATLRAVGSLVWQADTSTATATSASVLAPIVGIICQEVAHLRVSWRDETMGARDIGVWSYVYDADLEVELEVAIEIVDELADPWFELGLEGVLAAEVGLADAKAEAEVELVAKAA